MKKAVLLNADVSSVIARLGHTDMLVISDAGLSVPDSVLRIDLALTAFIPSFMQVLMAVTSEMQVEAVVLAREIQEYNSSLYVAVLAHIEALQRQQGNQIEIRYLSHQQFKQQTQQSRAVVRTGECSVYANIILQAGVTF